MPGTTGECRQEGCGNTLVDGEGYDGLCGEHADQHHEIREMHADIRGAFPRSRETVVACDGVWVATEDGRFIILGQTLAEAAEVAREDGHRARLVRAEIERTY